MLGFCLNRLSFTCSNKDDAFIFTKNMYEGLTYIISKKMESAAIYSDETIENIELFKEYTYNDFKNEIKNCDRDLYAFIIEITDHSPFINKLNCNEQDKILSFGSDFTLADESLHNIEYLYIFAHENSFYLASLASDNKWANNSLTFKYHDSNNMYKNSMLLNVSNYATGYYHINGASPLELHQYEGRIRYSKYFAEWFNSLSEQEKKYTIYRINQAYCVNFSCEPITKRLHFHLSKNISEIRGNNLPVGAGTMRILYYDEGGIVSILYGWVKEGNTDGYKSAEECCKQLLNSNEWAG